MGITHAWMVIANPKAGGGRGFKDWPVISNMMYNSGLHFTCLFTEHKHHAVELTVKAINEGYRNIVAVGGDGTVHEVVNGIFIQKTVPSTEISLAVIPIGDKNERRQIKGAPKTWSEAVKSLVHKNTVLRDVAKILYQETGVEHTRYMVNWAGIGYDAAVNFRYNLLKDEGKYGKWRYLRKRFHAFLSYSPVKMRVMADGEEFYSGKVFSGLAELKGDGSLMELSIQKGSLNSTLIHGRCKKITIESIPTSNIHIDGEAVGNSPFTFEMVPQAIRVVVPPHTK